MKYLLFLALSVFVHISGSSQGCVTSYVEPSFQLENANPNCDPNSGIIKAVNQQGGLAPFTYKLIELNLSNSTGLFTGLPAGAYTIELRDACGTVRTRQVTLVPYQFSFDYTVKKESNCNDGQVDIVPNPAGSGYQ